ncbi:aldehyde dehydrogenase [Flavobacterium crassostreae]|uniref:Aldehyde dehydrogenase n=1 Tax=Flavobacterium crassostreae TaxID=1763534 RepID=A0A1B9DKP3_9FLAO|nr:aldehyde dehydrogenase [Flavobacterium crassostreae]OCB70209.1 aldehyde dehydrogenase [Flavobacterium crassostreae]
MDFKTDLNYRKEVLTTLLHQVVLHEKEIINALYLDFKKPAFETVLTETSYIVTELKETIKNLKKWAKPKAVLPSILNFPSTDFIYKEPYGKVLVIAPWNYPYQLALAPLIAAVAAGNQVVLKPSELTPKTAAVLATIISKTFGPEHVEVVQGGVAVSQELLAQRWDYIFFTGSVPVGKIVAKAAAIHLTPITLELGGKNPCIVDQTAAIACAAKRIVWGKFINAGQTCIAPDYLLVQKDVYNELIKHLKEEIILAYGQNPRNSPDYARIINHKNWKRLAERIDPKKIVHGGQTDPEDNYIAPTLIAETTVDSLLMQEEIFGPILPILTYTNATDLQQIVSTYEKPLSLYVFTKNNAFARKIITSYSFGGGCINDTIIHFSNKRLPFGGVGHSGMGAYHGALSFNVFSHHKSIVKKANWLDLPMRYAPYKDKLKTIKKILKWI